MLEPDKVLPEDVGSYQVTEAMVEGLCVILSYRSENYSPEYIQGISGAAFNNPEAADLFEASVVHFQAEAGTLFSCTEMLFPGWSIPTHPEPLKNEAAVT
jgi:hypothetical protein